MLRHLAHSHGLVRRCTSELNPPGKDRTGAYETDLERLEPIYDPSDYEIDDEETFCGYACTDDCSGHRAGYEWAEENNVTDPYDCSGYSESFIEGCQAYTEGC